MDKKEYISKYIKFYTTNKVEQRGKQLYKNGAVQYSHFNDKTDTHYFIVKGSKQYNVLIRNLSKKDIETSCTCPFEWGTVCKHTVASLMFLSNINLDFITKKTNQEKKFQEKQQTKYRAVNAPVILNSYTNLTEGLIKSNCSELSFYSARDDNLKITNIEVKKDLVIFTVIKDFYHYFKEFKVTFSKKKEKLQVNTTEITRVKDNELKLTEVFCLLTLISNNTENFLDIIFNNKHNGLKKKIVKDYGIESKDFDKYFTFSFYEDKGFMIVKKPEATGLLKVGDSESYFSRVIDKISTDIDDDFFKKKIKKEFLLAFVLMEDDNKYYREHKFEYVPIIAKPNKAKTKLVSRFNNLEDINIDKVIITSGQNEIIKLIDAYDDDNTKEMFNLSKQIFQRLSQEQFVFFSNNHLYKINKNNLSAVNISQTPAKVVLHVYNDGKFVGIDLKFRIDTGIINYDDIDIISNSKIISYNNALYHLSSHKEVFLIRNFVKGTKINNKHKKEFFDKIIQPLSKNFEINFGKNTFENQKVDLVLKTRQVFISENEEYIIFQPQVIYDNAITVLLSEDANPLQTDEDTGKLTEYVRNFEIENDFLNLLANLHPDFDKQKENKFFYLHIDDFTKDLWFYNFFDKLNAQDIEIYGLKNLKNFKYSPYKGKVSTSIKSGQDWFDIEVNVSFGDNIVGIADIKKAVINKQKYIQLKDGSVGILPEEWLHKLEKYFRNGTIKKDKLEISKLRFSIIDELFDNINESEIAKELAEKRKRILEFKEISKTKIPKEITAKLRHYQKEGVNWLNFLDEMKWGGILADDMGLGKTLQILTFVQYIIKTDKTPNLIVVPTTLLFNWKIEIEKFASKLKTFYHYGVERTKNTKDFKKYNIIFTSYGTLLRDIEFLSKFKFNYLILDESQAIKNPASRRYKAVNLINAKNRIALTGTPIENSTFDLYAQMNFVNPGIFGSINNFKKNYSNPIDKEANESIANELQRIINPFLLRRTKENVAKELPSKTENIIYCEMEPEQQEIYDAYRNEYRNKLLKNIEKNGIGKSKMMVLEALTRLRQICDSPALISDISFMSKSIKIKEIINHITKKTAKHKVLIFSQFVGMLSLIKKELERLNIQYEYLDGKSSSKQREVSVNNFQNNKDLRIFLISLKAGGTGLNLIAADYVYLVDPWWNPAVENQAIDRCYRIGQNKKVFAYRMICKSTVEEKILNLQAKKKKIASDIIQTDENMIKTLKVEDIKKLFM